jgi:hypothetical protein
VHFLFLRVKNEKLAKTFVKHIHWERLSDFQKMCNANKLLHALVL